MLQRENVVSLTEARAEKLNIVVAVDKKDQADFLVNMGMECRLFCDQLGISYARCNMGDHYRLFPVKSEGFKMWLITEFRNRTETVPTKNALNSAVDCLHATATIDGEHQEVHLRVAKKENVIWYDLANQRNEVVQIIPGDWFIKPEAPVVFKRHTNTAPQVTPKKSTEGLLKLMDLIHIHDPDDRILFLVTMVACFLPDIPRPMMIFHGEKGAAKSTTLKVIRSLVDPAHADIMAMATSTKDMTVVQLAKNYMVPYDNLDSLSNEQSDNLCRAITGEGIVIRGLYTNDDEFIVKYKRCIALNGINNVVTRTDLVDRSVIFCLQRISTVMRKDEETFWSEFHQLKPEIIGHIFTILARAMEIHPHLKFDGLPRMADYFKWGCAIAEAMGIGGGVFGQAYHKNVDTLNQILIEDNPLASAIIRLLDDEPRWEGTAGALHRQLEVIAYGHRFDVKSSDWPKIPNQLPKKLRMITSNLKSIGITYEISRTANTGRKNYSFIVLERQEQPV